MHLANNLERCIFWCETGLLTSRDLDPGASWFFVRLDAHLNPWLRNRLKLYLLIQLWGNCDKTCTKWLNLQVASSRTELQFTRCWAPVESQCSFAQDSNAQV